MFSNDGCGVPLVTVLMSCHNAGPWLRQAVDSVLAQTFHDFEFILIDDGSTDATWSEIAATRELDRRVHAISKARTGLADSLNLGLARASGTWVARLDADDLWEPVRLEAQLEFARRHPRAVLIGSGFVEIDPEGRAVKGHVYPHSHRMLFERLSRLGAFFPHSSALFRRESAAAAGGYNPRFAKAQDWDLWLRLAETGDLACLQAPLVRVRKHGAQISADRSRRPQMVYAAAASTCHFLRSKSHPDPSASADDRWQVFLDWVDARIRESGFLDRHRRWSDARQRYFAAPGRVLGALRAAGTLLGAGSQLLSLVLQNRLGTSLPKLLAKEWIRGFPSHTARS